MQQIARMIVVSLALVALVYFAMMFSAAGGNYGDMAEHALSNDRDNDNISYNGSLNPPAHLQNYRGPCCGPTLQMRTAPTDKQRQQWRTWVGAQYDSATGRYKGYFSGSYDPGHEWWRAAWDTIRSAYLNAIGGRTGTTYGGYQFGGGWSDKRNSSNFGH